MIIRHFDGISPVQDLTIKSNHPCEEENKKDYRGKSTCHFSEPGTARAV
jgi:hypothetical protein